MFEWSVKMKKKIVRRSMLFVFMVLSFFFFLKEFSLLLFFCSRFNSWTKKLPNPLMSGDSKNLVCMDFKQFLMKKKKELLFFFPNGFDTPNPYFSEIQLPYGHMSFVLGRLYEPVKGNNKVTFSF